MTKLLVKSKTDITNHSMYLANDRDEIRTAATNGTLDDLSCDAGYNHYPYLSKSVVPTPLIHIHN